MNNLAIRLTVKQVVAAVLCTALLGSAVALMGCTAANTNHNTFMNMNKTNYSFDLLSEEEVSFNTTIPHTFVDFTTYFPFSGSGNVDINVVEGSHTTFTATADDPMTFLYTPDFTPSQTKSVAIIYRTDMDKDGELYANRSDGVQMGQPGGTQVWRWIPSEDFTTIAVVCNAWKDAAEDVKFTAFRFDPLNPKVNAGDSIDIRCVAFFDTEEGASGFNYEEYLKYAVQQEQTPDKDDDGEVTGAEVEWSDPTYVEMNTTAEDTRPGSLTFTESEDGSTVTISYVVNGETKSYTVPNDPINRFGGYAATDDLGRSL